MASHTAGGTAKAGFYWSPREWRIVTIEKDGARLPGTDGEHFRRVPALAMLLLAPVMGGLFVMFLPFIGFAMVGRHVAREAAAAVRRRSLHIHSRRPVRPAPAAKRGAQDLRKAS